MVSCHAVVPGHTLARGGFHISALAPGARLAGSGRQHALAIMGLPCKGEPTLLDGSQSRHFPRARVSLAAGRPYESGHVRGRQSDEQTDLSNNIR